MLRGADIRETRAKVGVIVGRRLQIDRFLVRGRGVLVFPVASLARPTLAQIKAWLPVSLALTPCSAAVYSVIAV